MCGAKRGKWQQNERGAKRRRCQLPLALCILGRSAVGSVRSPLAPQFICQKVSYLRVVSFVRSRLKSAALKISFLQYTSMTYLRVQ